jgi:hypothetical protein
MRLPCCPSVCLYVYPSQQVLSALVKFLRQNQIAGVVTLILPECPSQSS